MKSASKARAAGTRKKTSSEPRTEPRPREDRSKRLLDLVVALLGAREPVPFRVLREQFTAYHSKSADGGVRTFERDKADLLELGIPIRYVTVDEDDTIDEAGYIIDLRRYRLPEIQLTPEETAALFLAGSVARTAVGASCSSVVDLALKKLAFDLPFSSDTPLGKHVAVADAPLLVHSSEAKDEALAEKLTLLEKATRDRKRITVRHVRAATGEMIAREVDPYGLIYRQGVWLLVGYCHLRQGIRSFRVDRILAAALGPRPRSPDFELPPNFDIRRYAFRSPWTFVTSDPVPVELLVRPAASVVANEDFGENASRDLRPDGSTIVRFTCANSDYLVTRVLAAKGGLVVREPSSMRQLIRVELEAVWSTHHASAEAGGSGIDESAARIEQ
ncbi:MAG: WYL domain-containing protein [Pseudomonadota bacterium]